jgi:hypothetical protein
MRARRTKRNRTPKNVLIVLQRSKPASRACRTSPVLVTQGHDRIDARRAGSQQAIHAVAPITIERRGSKAAP